MGQKSQNRYQFGLSMMLLGVAWLGQAMNPTSPGGADVTKEEVLNLVQQLTAPLGITVDPALFLASIKELS